jgi:outer membrane protein TolC
MKRLTVALLLALAALSPAAAQAPGDTLRLTLDAALRRALDQSFAMRLARADQAEANGQVREALSAALPQLTSSITYTRQFASIYQGLGGADTSPLTKLFRNTPFGAPNLWTVQLQGTQLLWAGGKVGAGLAAARTVRQAASLNQAETATDVAFQVTEAYWNAALQNRLLAIATDNLDQARRQLHQVQLFRQAGTRAEYDLLRAQVDAANQEPAVVQAMNGHDLAVLELKRLLNLPADRPVTLETALESSDTTIPVLTTDSLGAPQRPGLAAADLAVTGREQLLRATRADRWPVLSMSTTYTEQSFPQTIFPAGSDVFHRGWSGELKFSFPIFLGFRTEARVEQARAAVQRAEAQRDQLRRRVEFEVAQAKADVAAARALLAARRETVRQAARAHYLAGVRYANGMTTQLEVSDARIASQQAAVNEVQATRDYLVALARLEWALGRPVPVVRQPIDRLTQTLNVKDRQP